MVCLGASFPRWRGRGLESKSRAVFLLATVVLAVQSLSVALPTARAFSLNYSDDVWTYLTVSGPDLTKPGSVESYIVSGRLAVTMTGYVHVAFWLDTSSQASRVVYEDDAMSPGPSGAGYTFTKIFQVCIPIDAIENRLVYAKLDVCGRHFSSFAVSLVQNQTESELQSQIASLQSQVSNLLSQIAMLESDKASLQANGSDLRNQIDSLTSQANGLQSQVDNVRVQSSTATNLFWVTTAIAAVFAFTTAFLSVRGRRRKAPQRPPDDCQCALLDFMKEPQNQKRCASRAHRL